MNVAYILDVILTSSLFVQGKQNKMLKMLETAIVSSFE